MTLYYTQEQIDEIGVFMANQFAEQNNALQKSLEQKISEMQPAEPAPSDTDSGTPASAGMFLDDGREIKTKVVTSDVMSTYYIHTPHGLDAAKILSYKTVLIHGNESTITSSKGSGGGNLKFRDYISGGRCSLILDDQGEVELLVNSNCVASTTITYLA